MPPTSKTSPISALLTSASDSALWHGDTVRLIRSATNPSNLERVSCKWKRHAGLRTLRHSALLQHNRHLSVPLKWCHKGTNTNTVTHFHSHNFRNQWTSETCQYQWNKKGKGCVEMTKLFSTANLLLRYHTVSFTMGTTKALTEVKWPQSKADTSI